MSNVKFYAVNPNDAWLMCSDDPREGTYVKYEAYEELERQLGDLVAIIESTDNRYCMCGDLMENHVLGGCSQPTGAFDYHYQSWKGASKFNTPRIDNDDWIEWGGGKQPVPSSTPVEVRFRNGATNREDSAGGWSWECTPDDPRYYDIVAYRVIENDGREG